MLILSALTFYVAILNVGAPMGRPGWLSPAGPPAGRLITVPKARDAATDTASLASTGNATLAGAQVFGQTVDVNVGGSLTVTSLQDQETQSQNQSSFGFSASVPILGAGATPPGASISGAVSHGTGNSNSVSDPTGLFAGDGGFQVNVAGTTTCQGCYVTSSAAAAAANLNSFATGALVDVPISNSSSSNVTSVGATLSVGLTAGATGFIPDPIQNQNSSASSVTAGGITQNANGKTITVADPASQGAANALAANGVGLTTQDAASRDGALAALPNIASEVGDQQQVAQAFAAAAPAIGQTEGQIANALQAQWTQNNPGADPNTNPYNEGGIGRAALQAAGGALLGGLGGGTALSALGGATGAAASQLAEPTLAGLINPTPGDISSNLAMSLASDLVGGLAGGASGAAAAGTFDEYNRQNTACKKPPCLVSYPFLAGYNADGTPEIAYTNGVPYNPPPTSTTVSSLVVSPGPGPTANVTPVNQVSAQTTDPGALASAATPDALTTGALNIGAPTLGASGSTSNAQTSCNAWGCADLGTPAEQAAASAAQINFVAQTQGQIAAANFAACEANPTACGQQQLIGALKGAGQVAVDTGNLIALGLQQVSPVPSTPLAPIVTQVTNAILTKPLLTTQTGPNGQTVVQLSGTALKPANASQAAGVPVGKTLATVATMLVPGPGEEAAVDEAVDAALGGATKTVKPPSSLYGQTLSGPVIGHTASLQDGVLGEQIGLQTLKDETGLTFTPLRNNSGQGADGTAIDVDPNTKIIYVAEVKSSQNGVASAKSAQGNPTQKVLDWAQNSLNPPPGSAWKSQPATNKALAQQIDDLIRKQGYTVEGVQVQVGVPAPGATGPTQIVISPW